MIKQDSFILIWMEKLSVLNCVSENAVMAINNVNMRIDVGEYVCISGLHGTDKISFINVISCLKMPANGKYFYDYNDITTVNSKKLGEIRSCIGFLFRNLNLIEHKTVFENIEIPLLYRDKDNTNKVNEVADKLGIKDLLGKKVCGLSDLDRNKIALARAQVVEPILIIVDEPAEGLDAKDRKLVLDSIACTNKNGTAVICFSERDEIINKASRHIVFENGRIKYDTKQAYRSSKEGVI